jgi:GT2 family glycosyltransferase/glycosyltransferase involved in cell wall biosynthesis
MTRATIIIPAHNGEPYLRPCLEAVLAQRGADFDVLVVDNGSSDGGGDLVAREYPQVCLIRSAAPLGFAGACNLGMRAALKTNDQRPTTNDRQLAIDASVGEERSSFVVRRSSDEGRSSFVVRPPDAVVLLNQDTVVDPGWLAALLRPLAEDARVGVVGSLARFPDGRIQHAGGQLLQPLGYGANIAAGLTRLPDPLPVPDYVAFLGTALRTTMLRAIGLLDEGFNPAYFEDADLCLRAAAAGWTIALAQDATLLHHEGAPHAADYRHAALIERNRLRLALKHRDPNELLGPFLDAERVQLRERTRAGVSMVLRQAYLHALLALPEIAVVRGWPVATRGALADALAGLRNLSSDKVTRWQGDKVTSGRAYAGADPKSHTYADAPAAPLDSTASGKLPGVEGAQTSPCHLVTLSTSHSLPPVAIIILTWNGLAVTQECIASIRAKTMGVDYTLIVVDNGSSDGTLEWLRAQGDIMLIANAENAGFTRGNNQGMDAAPPSHDLLLLNNDTLIVQEDWLARMRVVAHSRPEYGIVGCKLLWPDGRLQHAGTYMPSGSYWGYQVGGGEADVHQYPGVRVVEGVVGACMYIRADVRQRIGGLDEAFFSYFEDTDYCLRAAMHGYKTVCVGDVRVMHRENTSTKLNNVSWQALFGRAQATFTSKWSAYFERERYGRKLFWHSIIASPTGYAVSSRQFVTELDRRGVDVRLGCIWGSDITEPPTGDPRIEQLRHRPKDTSLVQVVYHQGDSFIKNSGRYRIGYSMLEPTGIPADWAAQANQMDEVWVPSSFNARTFRESGVLRPIYVVPLGVDPDYFHPGIAARRPSERFVFFSNFEWGERKAPEVLLKAFTDEFSKDDDVVLVLKVFNNDPSVNVRQQIADMRLRPDGAPIALMYNQRIAQHQMGSLYTSADCFVLPTRGEGWGMPILEAMACGLPTIATNWSAQADFLDEEIAYPLRVKRLIPAVAKCPYYVGYEWADPDVEHLRHLMRHVYEQRDEARARGRRAAEVVAERWTWARAVDRIIERLEAIEG